MFKLEVTADTVDGLIAKLTSALVELKPTPQPETPNKSAKAALSKAIDDDNMEDEAPEHKAKAAKSTKKMTAKVVEADETFDLEAAESDDDLSDEPAITLKDVIAACKSNREKAIKTLKKMKVSSVHELKPTVYSKFLAEIGA